MKKIYLLLVSAALMWMSGSAQTVEQVLQEGINIEKGNRIFLSYEDSVLHYYLNKNLKEETYFDPLEDSTLFLTSEENVHILMLPLNPLHFNQKSKQHYATDLIDSMAEVTLRNILSVFNTISRNASSITNNICKSNTSEIIEILQNVSSTMSYNNSAKPIIDQFRIMDKMSFADEKTTKGTLNRIDIVLTTLNSRFKVVDVLLDSALRLTKELRTVCSDKNRAYMDVYVLSNAIYDLQKINNQRKKSLGNMQKVYKMLKDVQVMASAGADKIAWVIPISGYKRRVGKVSVHTIEMYGGNYILNKEGEVVENKNNKKLLSKTFFFS